MRPIESGTLLASAARTADVDTLDQVNEFFRGVKVYINVSASADTPSVVFTIQEKDPVSGTYTTVLASAAVTGTGHTVLTVYPGVTVTANVSASVALPRNWRVNCNAADADSLTYSLGYSYLV